MYFYVLTDLVAMFHINHYINYFQSRKLQGEGDSLFVVTRTPTQPRGQE